MGMLEMLLGRKSNGSAKPRHSKAPASTQFAASQMSQQSGSVHSVRKDLLKLVLRETLTRNGIPGTWMAVELLRTTNSQREQGVHVRFMVRQWVPRLLEYGPALEQEFVHRLVLLDPMARNWLMGFSWQFAMEDTTACPPMPHPASWTASHRDTPERPVAMPAADDDSGDVIAGPVMIPKPLDDVRADLERLLALRDEDMKRHGKEGEDNFAATRPATL
jgi:hypothetical protein